VEEVLMLPADLFDMRTAFVKELGLEAKFDTSASILVITGSNASGKSILRRILAGRLRTAGIEPMFLSQQGRATGGIQRAIIYGSEDDQSTGCISVQTFIAAVRTMRGRETAHAVIWDEPEIGMGEELQIGTADWFLRQMGDWPEYLSGVVMLTHSRIFAAKMMTFPGAKWYNMNGYATVKDWLGRRLEKIEPEEMMEMSREKWKRIASLLRVRGE
jgi:predicted ATPase